LRRRSLGGRRAGATRRRAAISAAVLILAAAPEPRAEEPSPPPDLLENLEFFRNLEMCREPAAWEDVSPSSAPVDVSTSTSSKGEEP
jgi:hypothetical protein